MRTAVAVVASGVMWFLSTGVNNVWPLAWLAPLPLLVVVPDLPAGRAALAACAASALGALNLAVAYLRLPPVIVAGAMVFVAAPLTLIVLVWRLVARGERPIVTVLAYASLAATADYLISLLSPHGTFGSLAYSQAEVPVVLQIASLTGICGITFVVSLVPAALAVAWRGRRQRPVVVASLACALVPLGFVLAFGLARLAAPQPPRLVAVGLAAIDGAVGHFDDRDAAQALQVIRDYASRAETLAGRGVC